MAETQEEKRRRLIQEGMAARKAAGQGVKKVGAGLSSAAVAAAQGLNTVGEALIVNPQLRVGGFIAGDRPAPQPTPPSAVGVAPAVTPRPVTPPMEQNWSKPLLLAEKMEQRYSPIAPLPAPQGAQPKLSYSQLQRYAAATNPGAEVEGTPDILARYKANLAKTTPTPTAAPAMPRDLLDRRIAFGRQLDQQSMSGGFNLEDAQRDAAALSITPEQFDAFVAARKPLSEMRGQQERQQVEAIGSSSALNLRRGLQTEAGRMRSVGRQVGRDIKRGMDPEFARQAGLLKMTTPGIRSVDQGIAEREGQEKTAAAFQANENQYAKLMQDADTDPDLKRKLDRMLAKRAKKAA